MIQGRIAEKQRAVREINRLVRVAKYKIGSRTGASITFALLLFLVCAVVGSVVLVAGTAAAGRMSEIAEYDQRYYSVTSAAEIFADKLDNYSVTIERTKVEEEIVTTTYQEQANGTISVLNTSTSTTGPAFEATIKASTNDTVDYSGNISTGLSLLMDAAIDLTFDPRYVYKSDENFNQEFPALSTEKTRILNITHDDVSSGIAADDLKLTATLKLAPSGNILITFSNPVTDSADDRYSMTLVLSAKVEGGNINTRSDYSESVSGLIKVGTTITTSTRTIKITWTVEDIY